MGSACSAKTTKIYLDVKIMVSIVVSVLVLITQGALLDYYLISNNPGDNYQYAWICLDILAVLVWSSTLIYSFYYFRKRPITAVDGTGLKPPKNDGIIKSVLTDELRHIYLCWLIYVCCLVPRVAVIFKTIAESLLESDPFGPNTLKVTISLAAILFLFIVFTHTDAKPNTARLHYIAFLTSSVTFNILDSCEILDMLFITETRILLTYQLENIILSFACINFFLPVLALVELRLTSDEGKTSSKWFKFSYTLSHIFLTNLPFFCLRSFLWHGRNAGISTYLTKNLIMLVLGIDELIGHFGSYRLKVCKFCKHFYFLDKFLHEHNICPSCKKQHDSACDDDVEIPLEAMGREDTDGSRGKGLKSSNNDVNKE